jgi:transposase
MAGLFLRPDWDHLPRREQALQTQDDTARRTIQALHWIRGAGENFAAVLTREVFYRAFENRRQIASYLGLTPTPFQRGGMDCDRRISRAGNGRERKTLIQLAWLWLRYQPDSHLAVWFHERVGNLQGRTRRIAMACKLASTCMGFLLSSFLSCYPSPLFGMFAG